MLMTNKAFEYVTLTEAARILGLTTGRLRQMLGAKEIPGTKASPQLWLMARKDVENLARRRKR